MIPLHYECSKIKRNFYKLMSLPLHMTDPFREAKKAFNTFPGGMEEFDAWWVSEEGRKATSVRQFRLLRRGQGAATPEQHLKPFTNYKLFASSIEAIYARFIHAKTEEESEKWSGVLNMLRYKLELHCPPNVKFMGADIFRAHRCVCCGCLPESTGQPLREYSVAHLKIKMPVCESCNTADAPVDYQRMAMLYLSYSVLLEKDCEELRAELARRM